MVATFQATKLLERVVFWYNKEVEIHFSKPCKHASTSIVEKNTGIGDEEIVAGLP